MLGIAASEETGDGSSLVSVVEEQAAGAEYIFGQITHHDYYSPKISVRSATHKLIASFSSAPQFMDPSQSWFRRTAVHDLKDGTPHAAEFLEFYDLMRDPGETTNLASVGSRRGG
jgi:hypothetical protein